MGNDIENQLQRAIEKAEKLKLEKKKNGAQIKDNNELIKTLRAKLKQLETERIMEVMEVAGMTIDDVVVLIEQHKKEEEN